VKNLNLYVPKIEHVSVLGAVKAILRVGALVQHVFGAGDFGQPSPAAHVIRVQVRIDHEPDVQAVFPGHTNVQIGVVYGVAHGALSPTASTENIGSGNNVLPVKQLA
jgi:hypothetical protein